MGSVSTRESPPTSEIFEVLVGGSISSVEGFHGHDLPILLKMHTAGRINRKIFFDFNDQFYVMIRGTKNFM